MADGGKKEEEKEAIGPARNLSLVRGSCIQTSRRCRERGVDWSGFPS